MVCCVIALAGCGAPGSYDGKDLVDRAKKLHTELEAAHITVTDEITGTVVQEITYRFAGDIMQYMYIGRDPETGEEYYEFNNGTELDTWHTGDTAWSFAAKGSEGFYNYSRAKRHYFADGDQLLDDHAAALESAELKYYKDVVPDVILTYKADEISRSPSMEGVTEYEQIYVFGDDEKCFTLEVCYTQNERKYDYATMIFYQDPSAPIERAEPPALTEYTQ